MSPEVRGQPAFYFLERYPAGGICGNDPVPAWVGKMFILSIWVYSFILDSVFCTP